jgi:hypothetical protein
VLDHNKNVFVYDGYGNSLGQWSTTSALGAEPEGLAMANGHIWLADRARNVLFFQNGADRTSGSGIAPTKTFVLPSHVPANVKGLVTDGTTLWVVTEGSSDVVWRFTIGGTGTGTTITANGSFTLPSSISKPTGITIDMSGQNNGAMWVVDEEDDAVYRIDNGRTLTTGHATATHVFTLNTHGGNVAPQGIADPLSIEYGAGSLESAGLNALLAGGDGGSVVTGTVSMPAVADLLDAGNLDGLLGRDVGPAGAFAANDEPMTAGDADELRRITGLMRDESYALALA